MFLIVPVLGLFICLEVMKVVLLYSTTLSNSTLCYSMFTDYYTVIVSRCIKLILWFFSTLGSSIFYLLLGKLCRFAMESVGLFLRALSCAIDIKPTTYIL